MSEEQKEEEYREYLHCKEQEYYRQYEEEYFSHLHPVLNSNIKVL